MNTRPKHVVLMLFALSLSVPYAQAQAAACPVGAAPKRVVVTIAISDYAHPERFPHLDSPIPDADAIEALLVNKFGYHTYVELNNKDTSTQILPLRGRDAAKDAIDGVIDGLTNMICKDDDLIFFFSGHGTFKPDPNDARKPIKGYIVPYDAAASGYESAHLVGIKELLESINSLRAKHVLVILDACHSGIALKDALEGMKAVPDQITDENRRQEQVEALKSRKIIVSAQANETASDAMKGGHSLFGGALLVALEGRGAGPKKFIDDYDIGMFVRQNVSGSDQHPQTPDFAPFADNEGGSLVLPLDLDIASLYRSAFTSLVKGDIDDFDTRAKQAIERDPKDLRSVALRYRLALMQGNADEASTSADQLYQLYRANPPEPGMIAFSRPQELRDMRDQVDFWRSVLSIPRSTAKPPIMIHAYTGKTEQAQNLTELSGSGEYSVPVEAENLWFKLKAVSKETYVYAFVVDAAGRIRSEGNIVRARQNPIGTDADVLSLRQPTPSSDDVEEWHFVFSPDPIEEFDNGGGEDPPAPARLAKCLHYVVVVRPDTE